MQLALRVGEGAPGLAPSDVMQALRAVEVTQTDTGPSGFQLTFHTEAGAIGSESFALVANELLRPFSRVLVRVSIDGVATTLIDGFITHHQYVPANGPEESLFVVTGEDVSVKLDLFDWSREFPSAPDVETALEILAPWIAMLGLEVEVVPTPTSVVPLDYVPQQAGTDRAALQDIAARNGYVFYVTPADELFFNKAYLGPPPRAAPIGGVLDVIGLSSAVDAFRAEYQALAPSTYFGYVMETEVDPYVPIPVLTIQSLRYPPLAARPALTVASLPRLETRRLLWRDQELDPVRANLQAQNQTDTSADAVVTVSCDVSTVALGSIMRAPGTVGVRGAGLDYDGVYYLKQATHTIQLFDDERWDYTQSLVLNREGVGTLTQTLVA
jgi:hypothetical protein